MTDNRQNAIATINNILRQLNEPDTLPHIVSDEQRAGRILAIKVALVKWGIDPDETDDPELCQRLLDN